MFACIVVKLYGPSFWHSLQSINSILSFAGLKVILDLPLSHLRIVGHVAMLCTSIQLSFVALSLGFICLGRTAACTGRLRSRSRGSHRQ